MTPSLQGPAATRFSGIGTSACSWPVLLAIAGLTGSIERNGEPLLVLVGRGQHIGDTIETWLAALHTTIGLGRSCQISVAVLGAVITMASVPG